MGEKTLNVCEQEIELHEASEHQKLGDSFPQTGDGTGSFLSFYGKKSIFTETNILSRFKGVTIDAVWVGEWIY
jgi:hypothetical protein